MARGGSRPGAGRPRKGEIAAPKTQAEAERPSVKLNGLSPLEYMIQVMNDGKADDGRRDRMAVAAAPFVHMKPAEAALGKKEQKQAAADRAASGGKFAPPSAPKLVVSNK
ncbi:hypothetical protein [Yoonia sp.]|uniref:hypothetical protein n=1 Tax=Yoonia sp. TaxID=2212373 RepID=UPI002E00D74B|nr:hypothetical protein [Yoonia sp.]